MIKQTVSILLFLLSLTAFFSSGCQKDELNTDPTFKLQFSADTVIFDTVFTTIGSSSRALVIRNTGNTKVNIAKITLARGNSSPFRINIDGTATNAYQNLEIAANDSAYIFVKVTIDPNNVNNPLIESDSIVFELNGNTQNVKLVAWGQDAYFHLNDFLSGEITLPYDKPHVVYGALTVKDGCKLTIGKGTRLYFHSGGSLEIQSGASLKVNGTLESPVLFTSDNLEDYYQDLPGLWDGIWLRKGSKNISFTYADITNAKVGIRADSIGLDDIEPLRLQNSMIHNMTNYGIYANKAHIVATNCQITNCGGNVVSIENGGNYDFRNCTLARYFSGRNYPALYISNYASDSTGERFPGELTGAYFGNCIISGNQSDQIGLYELEGTLFNFQFDYCLVNWDKTFYQKYALNFTNCISNEEAKFIDPYTNDFQLDTLSFAKDAASMEIINSTVPDIKFDRKGISRVLFGKPDLGAYERVEIR
ncbi:MAG: right-handed parallel beta-helix repeat-containing protein [Bacteroidales bacterium]